MNESTPEPTERIYRNAGNIPLLDLCSGDEKLVLDLGCGAGDNAAELRRRHSDIGIVGVTRSPAEAAVAENHMDECIVADLEKGIPPEVTGRAYDLIILSHVLEHLSYPAELVSQAAALLKPGAACLIAVPNALSWAQRMKFLAGRFEYESAGVMDETHLRFFTYETAPSYLLAKTPALNVTHLSVTGSVPLWILRRHILPESAAKGLDEIGCRYFPNLFGYQVLIKAVLNGSYRE